MTLLRQSRPLGTTRLLGLLIDHPRLSSVIPTLPAEAFSSLIRRIGVEDSAELLALATIEQLVHCFDADLFVNQRPGERERFDGARFAVWLEVLLEAGEELLADRIAQLEEEFVTLALSSLILVLSEDALRESMNQGDMEGARQVDKALESSLIQEIDGYLLVGKHADGWDAALTLVLALDRSQPALCERLLDRLATLSSGYLDDLDELLAVLSDVESLEEDVAALREGRRTQLGYVEPRAARAFLELAKRPPESGQGEMRDPLTRAYFRERREATPARDASPMILAALQALPPELQAELGAPIRSLVGSSGERSSSRDTFESLLAALQQIRDTQPAVFEGRVEELAYLVNVVLAGHARNGQRLTPRAAVEAVLATICFGCLASVGERAGASELAETLCVTPADILFRRASSALCSGAAPRVPGAEARGLLYSVAELEVTVRRGSSGRCGTSSRK